MYLVEDSNPPPPLLSFSLSLDTRMFYERGKEGLAAVLQNPADSGPVCLRTDTVSLLQAVFSDGTIEHINKQTNLYSAQLLHHPIQMTRNEIQDVLAIFLNTNLTDIMPMHRFCAVHR